ncbi:hypothetical protein K2173_012015 [Erythroxylum novogranatense]|uniref:Uncharacterized protein n=1 Tax=Erythroxylum novogranatense TaxID=1862640 RepID=A0AAV8TH64_9ROSI|nr:hypothetical protein K2173_012015 [Erythroxylum novogranatense]
MADNGSFWIEESNGQPFSGFKRKDRPKKMKYVGWASVPLYGFLEHIGKDTSNQLSQYDVTSIIDKYAKERGLFHPTKKKRIVCDEWLVSLFGRKTISKNKIHDLLDLHLAENQVVSDDDSSFGSEEDDIMHDPQNLPTSERKSNTKRKFSEIPKSGFASIVPDNIKLVYLRRSLVQDLLKDPKKFETKVVGSFVRIRSDPNDYLQKNFHMLVQVTVCGKEDNDTDIILQVANFGKDVYISMLSDNKFLEEECEDLRQSVKQGLLKRPAVAEFEEKARLLHEDVTKHWIVTELDFLQKLIDRANEKGWRKEYPFLYELDIAMNASLILASCTLLEYLDRKQLLQTPDEQARLLHEVPEVIEDEIEVETDGQDFPENTNEASHGSTRISPHRASDSPVLDIAASGTSSNSEFWIMDSLTQIPTAGATHPTNGAILPINGATQTTDGETHLVDAKKNDKDHYVVIDLSDDHTVDDEKKNSKDQIGSQVIDLSDDDDENMDHQNSDDLNPGIYIWYYVDPHGHIQGPFSISALKRWKEADYFPPDFKVWKTGQSQEEAVLLSEVICQQCESPS